MSWLDELEYDSIFYLDECASSDAAQIIEKFADEITPDDLRSAIKSFTCFCWEEMEIFKSEVLRALCKSGREEIISEAEKVFKMKPGEAWYYVIPWSFRRDYETKMGAIDAWRKQGGILS